jgi:hypothetical protein
MLTSFQESAENVPRPKNGGPMNFGDGIKGKSFFLFAALTVILLNSGCGGSYSQAESQPQSISVVLSTASANVVPGGTTTVSATVLNDSANAGVVWGCAPANACGLFSPSSTASAVASTYTAPAVVPAGSQVTVTAKSVTDPTKSASSVVTITDPASEVQFDVSPPPAIHLSQTVSVSASVSDDTAGVTWSCFPAGTCGTFTPASTGNEVVATYVAPSSAAPGALITIVATSVTDINKSASASTLISATAANATLSGQYAFFLTSPTGKRGTASLLGSINLSGDGTVAGGVADIISPGVLDLEDQILPTSANPQPNTSSYTVDSTGHGTMNVRTASGQQLAFSFSVTSPAHALLTEIDGNPGSGTMDLQQHPTGGFSASQVAGGFSFTMTGTAKANAATKVSYGGVFAADGVGSLSGGTLDIHTAAIMTTSPFSGSFSAPDSNGRGTLQLGGGRSFTYYVISSKALRLFEADNLNLMGGSAYAQGGSFIFFADNYFYQNAGWSSPGRTTTAGELFIAEGDVDISAGISDSSASGSPATPKSAVQVSGSYDSDFPDITGSLTLEDAGGRSTFNLYVVDFNVNILDPNASPAGFSSTGGNALMLHTDANVNGTGVLIRNTNLGFPPSLSNNALQLTNPITSSTPTSELDLVGVVLFDGLGHLSGLVDYDQSDSSNPVAVLGASIAGSFVEDTLNEGRATGSITISTPSTAGAYPFISPASPSFNVAYYRINSSQAFVLQTDASASSSGFLLQQLLP